MAVKIKHIQAHCKIYTDKFFKSEEEMNQFLKDLVKVLNMDIIIEPRSAFCGQEGNLGLTGQVGLVTSHAAIHSWDEYGYHMIDIYSCKDFSIDKVSKFFHDTFGKCQVCYAFGDRDSMMRGSDKNVLYGADYWGTIND